MFDVAGSQEDTVEAIEKKARGPENPVRGKALKGHTTKKFK